MTASHANRSLPASTTGARRVALIVAAAYFMQNLDGAIINNSLPQMASVFRVRPADLNIGITAYILSTAAFVPLGAVGVALVLAFVPNNSLVVRTRGGERAVLAPGCRRRRRGERPSLSMVEAVPSLLRGTPRRGDRDSPRRVGLTIFWGHLCVVLSSLVFSGGDPECAQS